MAWLAAVSVSSAKLFCSRAPTDFADDVSGEPFGLWLLEVLEPANRGPKLKMIH